MHPGRLAFPGYASRIIMELQELLQQIDTLKAEIDALRPLSPDLEGRIMQKLRLDWNFHSSNIEGNSLTFGETKTFLLHGLTAEGKPLKDHLEIRGHNEAIEGLGDIIKGDRPLTEYEIKSLHQIILGEPYQIPAQTAEGLPTQRWVMPGKYKSQPNHVRTATGETFYFASPEDTPAEMERLMAWYNEAIADQDLPPLITAATFHYKFIRIHPFDDGNGRIARILMNLILMKRGFPPVIIRTDDKENYYRALRQADGDDLEAFIVYVGEQLVRSLEIYLKGARGKGIEEQDDIDKKIALFKAELERLDDSVVQERKSEEAVSRVVQDSIAPLFEAIHQKLQNFDELFMAKELRLYPSSMPMYQSIDDWIRENPTRSWRDINTTTFKYKWKGFNRNIAYSFDYQIEIRIEFKELTFVAEPKYLIGKTIVRPYHQELSEEECADIASNVAENVLRRLQAAIKKHSEVGES